MKAFFKRFSFLITFIFIITGLFNLYLPNTVKAYSNQNKPEKVSNDVKDIHDDIQNTFEIVDEAPKSIHKVTESIEDIAQYINEHNMLPENYITKSQAIELGWQSGMNLWYFAPGKNIGGDFFNNYEELLPSAPSRTWYECDINYKGGYRGSERIVFSNDGLVYKTNDHYKTFTCYNAKTAKHIN